MDCSFNKHKKELSSLLCVLNEGCVRELISSDENYNTLHQKLLISLAKNSPMEKEYLSWAIDSWAMALNIIKVTDFANQQLENTKIGLNSNDDSKNNPFFLKCLKLAYSGDKKAQFNLGYFYAHGLHTKIDISKSIYWYKKSAAQGFAAAQFNLSNLYSRCKFTTKYEKESIYWLERAANNGFLKAQEKLAVLNKN